MSHARRLLVATIVATAATGCIPPQAARVVQIERYEQELSFPGCDQEKLAALSGVLTSVSDTCAKSIQCILGAGGFLGDATFRTILETHGGKKMMAELLSGRVVLDGTLTITLSAGNFTPGRFFLCPFGGIPLIGYFVSRIKRHETLLAQGHGEFRVLIRPPDEQSDAEGHDSAGDESEAPARESPHRKKTGPSTQLLTFGFRFGEQPDEQPTELNTILSSSKPKLRLNVQILPDNLPSGPIAVPPETVVYDIELEHSRGIFLPGDQIRPVYNQFVHVAHRSDPDPRCTDVKSIGTLKFQRNDPDAMWINLRVLDCVTPW